MKNLATKHKIAAAGSAVLLSLGVTAGVALQPASAAPVAGMSTAETSSLPVLKKGSTGEPVKVLQRSLKITADGSFGSDTEKAVRAFQKRAGITVDGTVGPATWSKLLSELGQGAQGDKVKVLQATLGDHGYKIAVDGSFGPATVTAVKAFQKKRGLVADGAVGPNTWRALLGSAKTTPTTPTTPTNPGTPASGGPDTRYPNPKKAGYKNGQLPDSALCKIPFSPNDRIACYVLPDLIAFNEAHKKAFGSNIDITGTNNAYRTLAVQQYYWDTLPRGQAARPGTSNHGWGMAIDIAGVGGHGTARYRWLNTNAPKFGFDDNVSHEAWHWEYER